nr:uncharacterized protein LOC128694275 [Cherax quadricarinatus]
MTEEEDGFDHLLTKLGFGPWQGITLVTTFLVAMILPSHLIGSPLVSAPVPFRCFTDALSLDDWPQSLPYREGKETMNSTRKYFNGRCLELSNLSVTQEDTPAHRTFFRHRTYMSSCPYIEYDNTIFSATIVSEFHLVCDELHLQPFYQMLFNCGRDTWQLHRWPHWRQVWSQTSSADWLHCQHPVSSWHHSSTSLLIHSGDENHHRLYLYWNAHPRLEHG